MDKLSISPPHAAAEPVSRNEALRTMSGGEPSSIKRLFLCAAVNLYILMRKPVPCLFCVSAGGKEREKLVSGAVSKIPA